ncbi:MAG: AAA family ATPase [Bacteroidetes bacterium]|nr:AAA family ATPase [Bacteroidota bacterium]
MLHFTSIKFKNYKSFSQFTVALDRFNIFVGPNNAGKSTVIGAFKILAEGIRKARSRKPTFVTLPNGNEALGYEIDLDQVPIATENVFHDYNDDTPAVIRFRLSDGSHLQIFFPERGRCFLNYESDSTIVRSPKEFKELVDIEIGFVPILGPVDHEEKLYQKEAARLALLTYTASRNFRNIWHHYDDDFDEFKSLVKSTWPGMDIDKPEINTSAKDPKLDMFCPEERIPREIFWAGFGFQVWCQMLTYIIKNKRASIFLIDEPDIYLHSDLQRQLLGILRALGPDIIIATHSTELISEAEPNEILLINKANQSAKRIKDSSQLKDIFQVLGSNLNPVLTHIAKSKRVLFVEGKDFAIFSKIARILNKEQVANRMDFAVVPVEGFNPGRLKAFKEGIERTIGSEIISAVIFDRDFKSDKEVEKIQRDLEKGNYFAHIHTCKEIENFIIIPKAIEKALIDRINESNLRSGKSIVFKENIEQILDNISQEFKYKTQAQLQSHREKYERSIPGTDVAVIKEAILKEFDDRWGNLNERFKLIPGKDFLSRLNNYFQENYNVTVTQTNIINSLPKSLVPEELRSLIEQIDNLRTQPVSG